MGKNMTHVKGHNQAGTGTDAHPTASNITARKDVAKQLKAARQDANLTQEALASRVGTKKSNISRFERGNYNPSLDFLVKLADGLGKHLHIIIR